MPDLKLSNYLYQAGSALEDTSKVIGGFASELIGAENNVLASTYSINMQQMANNKLLQLQELLADPTKWKDNGNGEYIIDGKTVQQHIDDFQKAAEEGIGKDVNSWGAKNILRTQFLPKMVNNLSVGISNGILDARMVNSMVKGETRIAQLINTPPVEYADGIKQYDDIVSNMMPFLSAEKKLEYKTTRRIEFVKNWYFSKKAREVSQAITDNGYAAGLELIREMSLKPGESFAVGNDKVDFAITDADIRGLQQRAATAYSVEELIAEDNIGKAYNFYIEAEGAGSEEALNGYANELKKNDVKDFYGLINKLSKSQGQSEIWQEKFRKLEKEFKTNAEISDFVGIVKGFRTLDKTDPLKVKEFTDKADAFTKNAKDITRVLQVVGIAQELDPTTMFASTLTYGVRNALVYSQDPKRYKGLTYKDPATGEDKEYAMVTEQQLADYERTGKISREQYDKLAPSLEEARKNVIANAKDADWGELAADIMTGKTTSLADAVTRGLALGGDYVVQAGNLFKMYKSTNEEENDDRIMKDTIGYHKNIGDLLATVTSSSTADKKDELNQWLGDLWSYIEAAKDMVKAPTYQAMAGYYTDIKAKTESKLSRGARTDFLGRLTDASLSVRSTVTLDEINKAMLTPEDEKLVLQEYLTVHKDDAQATASLKVTTKYLNNIRLSSGLPPIFNSDGTYDTLTFADLEDANLPPSVSAEYKAQLVKDEVAAKGMSSYETVMGWIRAGGKTVSVEGVDTLLDVDWATDISSDRSLTPSQKAALTAELDRKSGNSESVTASGLYYNLIRSIHGETLKEGELALTIDDIKKFSDDTNKSKWTAALADLIPVIKEKAKTAASATVMIAIMNGEITDQATFNAALEKNKITLTTEIAPLQQFQDQVRRSRKEEAQGDKNQAWTDTQRAKAQTESENENTVQNLWERVQRTESDTRWPDEEKLTPGEFKKLLPQYLGHNATLHDRYYKYADDMETGAVEETIKQALVGYKEKAYDSLEPDPEGEEILRALINNSSLKNKSTYLDAVDVVNQNMDTIKAQKAQTAMALKNVQEQEDRDLEKEAKDAAATVVLSWARARIANKENPMTEEEFIGFNQELLDIYGGEYEWGTRFFNQLEMSYKLLSKEELAAGDKLKARAWAAYSELVNTMTVEGFVHDQNAELLTQDLIEELFPVERDETGKIIGGKWVSEALQWSDRLQSVTTSGAAATAASKAAMTTIYRANTKSISMAMGLGDPFPGENVPVLSPKLVQDNIKALKGSDVGIAYGLLDDMLARKAKAATVSTGGISVEDKKIADIVFDRVTMMADGLLTFMEKPGADQFFKYTDAYGKEIRLDYTLDNLDMLISMNSTFLDRAGLLDKANALRNKVVTGKDNRYTIIETYIKEFAKGNATTAAFLQTDFDSWKAINTQPTATDQDNFVKAVKGKFQQQKFNETVSIMSGDYDISEAYNEARNNGQLSWFIGRSGNKFIPFTYDPAIRDFFNKWAKTELDTMNFVASVYCDPEFNVVFDVTKNAEQYMDGTGRISYLVRDKKILEAFGVKQEAGVTRTATFYMDNVAVKMGGKDALLVMEVNTTKKVKGKDVTTFEVIKAFVPWQVDRTSIRKQGDKIGRWIEVQQNAKGPLTMTTAQNNKDKAPDSLFRELKIEELLTRSTSYRKMYEGYRTFRGGQGDSNLLGGPAR